MNIQLFQEQWKEIEEKLDEIRRTCKDDIAYLNEMGRSYEAYEISEDGINCVTSDSWSYGGYEKYSHFIPWERIAEPLGDIEKYYKELADQERYKDLHKKEEEVLRKEKEEKKLFEKLKQKYEN